MGNRAAYRKKLKKEMDGLWSEIIKVRDKYRCVRCGKTRGLQSAHIHSRSRHTTAWDVRNGICLCAGCHIFWAHKHPIEFAEFVKDRLGNATYYELLQKAKSKIKVDLDYMEKEKSALLFFKSVLKE